MVYNLAVKLDPMDEKIEEWEEGLTPVQRFEKLIQYGQVGRLFKNSFFRNLDKIGQVDAISHALDNLIHQLDIMASTLMKVSSTHPEGVKLNRLAVGLTKAKSKLLDDFAKGMDIVSQLADKAESKRFF